MVKVAHNLEHDPTLAFDIFNKFNSNTTLSQHYASETSDLLFQLKELDATGNANDISRIIPLLKEYSETCEEFNKLSPEERDKIQLLFQNVLNELTELHLNVLNLQIQITCAMDGYTLNRTTYLITTLQAFIQEQDVTAGLKEVFLSQIADQRKKHRFNLTNEPFASRKDNSEVAHELKNKCESIRTQIGSPETKAKGLIIDLMQHLCEANSKCQELANKANSKLLDCIVREINQIHRLYPELAKAGEKLQKAYCKLTSSKTIMKC